MPEVNTKWMRDAKVGEEVGVLFDPTYNVRRNKSEVIEGVVTKVGRKYIHAKFGKFETVRKFDREDGQEVVNVGGAEHYLFESERAAEEHMEAIADEKLLKQRFLGYGSTGLTANQLKRIKAIVEE